MRLFTILLIITIFYHDVTYSLEQACPDPRKKPSAIRASQKCLPLLRTNPQLYAPCKTKICYLFLQEAQIIILPSDFLTHPTNPSYHTPFPCGTPQKVHPQLNGLAFSLHNQTSSANELCIWAGPTDQCTFNAMVDLIDLAADDGYNFAISGILLQMPDRECRLFPSTPIVEDTMIVIGLRGESPVSVSMGAAWRQLTGPFDSTVWSLFIFIILLQLLICFLIAGYFPGYSAGPSITTFRVFIGDLNISPADGRTSEPGYVIAARFFRISLVLLVAIFVMLYELAAVNFLFQQLQMEIGKSVRSLSNEELGQYGVLKNSALEQVWNASVNPSGTKYDTSSDKNIPWRRCETASKCMEWTDEGTSTFTVTFEMVGKYLLRSDAACSKWFENKIWAAESTLERN